MARDIRYMIEGPGVMSSTEAALRKIVQCVTSGTSVNHPVAATVVSRITSQIRSFCKLEWLLVPVGEYGSRRRKPTGILAILSAQVIDRQQEEHAKVCRDAEHRSYRLLVEALHRACVIT